MIAYDIYLKTSFEFLIQERIRSFLYVNGPNSMFYTFVLTFSKHFSKHENIDLKSLYFFAAYSLITSLEKSKDEQTKKEMIKQGKQQLKKMFEQGKALDKLVINYDQSTRSGLKELDDLIDFSLYTLINEMDK